MTTANPTPQAAARPGLDDIIPFPDFARECERRKLATKTQLQWWLRYRATNGLAKSGAVVEVKPNPASKRPMLFVVRPRFVDWLLTQTAAEAAQ